MSRPLLHPQITDDPRLLRWLTNGRRLFDLPAQLSALINEGVLERAEVDTDEVRTWLGPNRSWNVDGPRVRSALFEALSGAEDAELSDEALRAGIEDVLARDVAPLADSHGGAISVVSVHDGILTLALDGACLGCPMSGRTLGDLVARSVQSRYPQIREIRTAPPRRRWLPLSPKRVVRHR
ncbi:NifU family protein [Mycobacterium vicinigordonae]|uniref:NifU family protein n=1 Tax=Mycobacterium vicinigordonae TaxID=1719132 RepID=A0A7D6E238_9MYCO|nr:NifU family protein [Mycobacterium vicinigordonae]QLL09868.1 NifU family protein [Mycobacterium vicinigordonae]